MQAAKTCLPEDFFPNLKLNVDPEIAREEQREKDLAALMGLMERRG